MRFRIFIAVLTLQCLFAASGCADQETPSPTAPAIRLNTVGYVPESQKRASVAHAFESFTVVRVSDGEEVFSGASPADPIQNADTGETLYIADFSALREPGEYRLEIAGAGESAPFRISQW